MGSTRGVCACCGETRLKDFDELNHEGTKGTKEDRFKCELLGVLCVLGGFVLFVGSAEKFHSQSALKSRLKVAGFLVVLLVSISAKFFR